MAKILAIETSCDETAAAVVEQRTVVSSQVASQIPQHQEFGGVVPEVASRLHVEAAMAVVEAALEQAQVGIPDIAAIAVTVAPGLVGSLLVGLMTAKTLALVHNKPFLGIHHLEGHIFSGFLADPHLAPPCLCLLVSGGHTSLIHVLDYGVYRTVGQTRDDAVGEAFDKVARLLHLGYPGGPIIDRLAAEGDPQRFALPMGKVADPYDSSFSGLKTAVLRLVEKLEQTGHDLPIADIAASFQATVTQVLTQKALACAQSLGLSSLLLTGGVAANRELRQRLQAAGVAAGIRVVVPPFHLCTDNAAMIGAAAAVHFERGARSPLSLTVQSRLGLEAIAALYA
ncbi:MAG: tRNA (adenosine(37)-N6)-threonylcarbamoyltransferase complex transferase subunit TsaD [Cyanobacteriota bacterium]|nr:tRNA (adenosine(37)-N6)-threonylcarbamoyltransferase complex transferase subunit TsaD [Cyanobacteriota bacterium]